MKEGCKTIASGKKREIRLYSYDRNKKVFTYYETAAMLTSTQLAIGNIYFLLSMHMNDPEDQDKELRHEQGVRCHDHDQCQSDTDERRRIMSTIRFHERRLNS